MREFLIFWAQGWEGFFAFVLLVLPFFALALLRGNSFQINLAMDLPGDFNGRKRWRVERDAVAEQVMLGLNFALGWFGKYRFLAVHFVSHVDVIHILAWGGVGFLSFFIEVLLMARVRVVNRQWVLVRRKLVFLGFYCAGRLWLKKKKFFHL